MEHDTVMQDGLVPESTATFWTGARRLLIGLLQGAALYFLYHASESRGWPATEPRLFAPVLLVCLIVPVLWTASFGLLSRSGMAVWILVATALVAGLGFYDAWRGDTATMAARAIGGGTRLPSPTLTVLLMAGFFIAHSLRLAAAQDGRGFGSYAGRFEIAWKLAVQIAFSILFVAALWAALGLGAALFMLVKLDFLKELLARRWFSIPVTAVAFACAMHVTDVRPAIVRGIRSLLLVLLSWILPVATLLIAGFLGSLPLTGLEPLWATKSATGVLLGAAALLVILVNAAWQHGGAAASVAPVIRVSARVAGLALVPIVAIAAHALALRVGDYGWTTDRIIAAACVLVAACYACGYAASALRPTDWMGSVAPTNTATAYLILAVLLALLSPFADPARLSVNHQLARLEAGLTPPSRFDFAYLRFEGARYGQEALARLAQRSEGTEAALIREKAKQALAMRPGDSAPDAATGTEIAANLTVRPDGQVLPASFAAQNWTGHPLGWQLPGCLRLPGSRCDAFLIDLSGDGKAEVILLGADPHAPAAVMTEDPEKGWTILGHLSQILSRCKSVRRKMLAGDYRPVLPPARDLEIGGSRVALHRQQDHEPDCPPD